MTKRVFTIVLVIVMIISGTFSSFATDISVHTNPVNGSDFTAQYAYDNPFAGNDTSGGVVIEFTAERTGAIHVLGTIFGIQTSGGRIYFTPGSYLGYNGSGGYYDANMYNYALVKDYIGEKANVKIELTPSGFTVTMDGVVAYTEEILQDPATGSSTVTDFKKVLTDLSQTGNLYFGYGSWWNANQFDEANINLTDVHFELADGTLLASYFENEIPDEPEEPSDPVVEAPYTGEYVSLDTEHPIDFKGTYITYQGETITLGEKAIYVDGSISDEVADQYQYVYNDIKDALSAASLTDGSEEEPMTVYIAPYTYWLHDPDATDTVSKADGYSVPYGLIVNCEWLKLVGLTDDPANVVLAANRGQSQGAIGNYTMFFFNGDGLTMKNLTFGNYCNADLVYPLKDSLSHVKRTDTITQAQLATVNGDKVYADNCNFISRLNLCPPGGSRTLYHQCHFESTNDSLNGNAVYLECDFDFYAGKPFYSTTSVTLLDCTFHVLSTPQYFTKEGGSLTVIDSEFLSDSSDIGWTAYPAASLRCYQENVLLNGTQFTIAGSDAAETVDITGKELLKAYKITAENGTTIYNTYNLLGRNDGWDPMGVKDAVISAGADQIPTQLSITGNTTEIESGMDTAVLKYSMNRFGYSYSTKNYKGSVSWSIDAADQVYASIQTNSDGSCTVTGTNTTNDKKDVIVHATADNGLEAAYALTVTPLVLTPPAFLSNPVIGDAIDGTLKVNYTLDLGNKDDYSLISWYRCTDAQGSNPIQVSISRLNEPEYEYQLTAGDVGYYIMASVAPKHNTSEIGTAVSAITQKAVKASEILDINIYTTDFQNFPNTKQISVIPGFWTLDLFCPSDMSYTITDTTTPWIYGTTGDGSVGYGFYQGARGARMMYSGLSREYSDMSLDLVVDPAKTAGQGFGSAGQYMDICVKFDTNTLSGYGLRIIRTAASSSAVTFKLVKYQNGVISDLSEGVQGTCFVTDCHINVSVSGTTLSANVYTTSKEVPGVTLTAQIETNGFGGVAIQTTGTTGTGGWQNTQMLHQLSLNWAADQSGEEETTIEETTVEETTAEDTTPEETTEPETTMEETTIRETTISETTTKSEADTTISPTSTEIPTTPFASQATTTATTNHTSSSVETTATSKSSETVNTGDSAFLDGIIILMMSSGLIMVLSRKRKEPDSTN